jgi:hypothetical protein
LTAAALAYILSITMSTSTTTEHGEPAKVATPASSPLRRRIPFGLSWLALALLACILLALAWLLAPTLHWAYDIELAGRLIDRGLAWPEPRGSDSLPAPRNEQALDQALPYLADAIRQRPTHSQAYRLAGQIYAARGAWDQAAAALEQARALAPHNPLYAWETSLVYRRMQQAVDQAPHESLIETMAAGHLIAPGQLVKSLYCNDQGAASCYFGRSAYTQPFAAFPDQPAVSMPVLFLHPPASLERELTLPADRPALRFVIGLDPVARAWGSDGATFRVWVKPAAGARQLAGELKLDRATALRGWVPGWADLAPWAGQTVTLELESSAGPADDLNDDWYGWGDIALTTLDGARYAAMLPKQHMRAARSGVH